MDVLKKINKLRIDRGWSVYRLSEEAELPQSTVTNMFNRGTLPSLNTLESICSAFGITVSEFFASETQDKDDECSKEELDRLYSSLTPSNKRIVIDLMKALSNNK